MFTKFKWILGILMVFVLILGTNLIDRDSFTKMRNSVVTMYEDRIIASDIIFDMSQVLHTKELALMRGDTAFYSVENQQLNAQLEVLADLYDHTDLTEDEQIAWRKTKSAIRQLSQREQNFKESGFENTRPLERQIENIQVQLQALSKVQVVEGERQRNLSQEAIDTVELFTHIEIYMLVFLAVCIQVIILYKGGK